MTSTTSLPEGTLLFEQQLLRVCIQLHRCGAVTELSKPRQAPFETVRRHFRASQKHVERDFTALSKTAKEATKRKDITREDAIQVLEGMIARVEGLAVKVCAFTSGKVLPHLHVSFRRSTRRPRSRIFPCFENERSYWSR
jgi:hypothetical protein